MLIQEMSKQQLKKSTALEIENIKAIISLKKEKISLIEQDLEDLNDRKNHFTERLNNLNKIGTKQAD